jgi:hypothetical protein
MLELYFKVHNVYSVTVCMMLLTVLRIYVCVRVHACVRERERNWSELLCISNMESVFAMLILLNGGFKQF